MNGLRNWIVAGLTGLALVLTAGCQSGGSGGNGGSDDGAPVEFDMDFAYLLQQVGAGESSLYAFSADQVLTGELVATDTDSGDVQSFDWSVYVDEVTLDAASNKTIVLDPGTYDFDLTVSRGDHTYRGEALLVPIVDGENTIPLTLAPVIGLTTTNVVVAERLVDFRFAYSPTEISLAGIGTPRMRVFVNGTDVGTFDINPVTGLSGHMFLDLAPGDYTIHLELLDGSVQRGKSEPADEAVTVSPGSNLTIDLVALHGEVEFVLDVAGGDASFGFNIPAEVVSEAGGLADLEAHLVMTTAETGLVFEDFLTLVDDGAGGATASFDATGFQFEDVTISLAFSDLGDDPVEVLGSCVHTVTLSTLAQTGDCPLTLRRRAVIGGSLLATLGVNVFTPGWEPIGGARVLANGTDVGLTGSNPSFGTDGYLKVFLEAGSYTIRAESGGLFGEATVTLDPLGIDNVDVFVDTPIVGSDWLVVGSPTSNIGTAAAALGATVVTTSNFGTYDLTDVGVIIFGEFSVGRFVRDAATADKVADFVSRGGGLYVEMGGQFPDLDYSWVPNGGIASTPGNNPASDLISIAAPGHPIAAGVTDSGLDGWGASSHGDFLSTGGLTVVFTNTNTGLPVLIAGSFGAGNVVYANLDPTCGCHGFDAPLVLTNALDFVSP